MEPLFAGIDVSKDRLDVALRPTGDVLAVERNAAGLAALIEKLQPLAPALVALEATGGFETVAAGEPKMVALIAVARKLLTILNAILRDQKPWQTA